MSKTYDRVVCITSWQGRLEVRISRHLPFDLTNPLYPEARFYVPRAASVRRLNRLLNERRDRSSYVSLTPYSMIASFFFRADPQPREVLFVPEATTLLH